MMLSMDGIKVSQIDLATCQESLKREETFNKMLLTKLKVTEECCFKKEQSNIQLSGKLQQLQNEVTRLTKINELKDKTLQK